MDNKIFALIDSSVIMNEEKYLMEIDKVQKNKKYTYIEIMRIIAIFFVIFNHTGNKGFFLFSQHQAGGMQFWIYLLVSVFCKFSVPLFWQFQVLYY